MTPVVQRTGFTTLTQLLRVWLDYFCAGAIGATLAMLAIILIDAMVRAIA